MKVLHITYWFPNKNNPKEALWIERIIKSLDQFTQKNDVIHLQVKPGDRFNLFHRQKKNLDQTILEIPLNNWFLVEILSLILLVKKFLLLRINKKYDIINFHIAYPNLTYFHILKRLFKRPVIIYEHWSAYHFNFGVNKELPRIRRIFYNNLPLISVSQCLLKDIQAFSGNKALAGHVIPNIVDTSIFRPLEIEEKKNCSFFMVSQWKWPKNPILVLEAFSDLIKINDFKDFKLRIGGYGTQVKEMEDYILEKKIQENVVFLGVLDSKEIAREMNSCLAFLHASEYETFSVVIAEALSCNCLVIASKVGAIEEYINDNLILLDNKKELWFDTLRYICSHPKRLLVNKGNPYSSETIGLRYQKLLSSLTSLHQ